MDSYHDTTLPFCTFGACQFVGGVIALFVWSLQKKFGVAWKEERTEICWRDEDVMDLEA